MAAALYCLQWYSSFGWSDLVCLLWISSKPRLPEGIIFFFKVTHVCMHDNVHASEVFCTCFPRYIFSVNVEFHLTLSIVSQMSELLVFQVYFVCCADTQVSVGLCLNMPINHMWYNKCFKPRVPTTCFVHWQHLFLFFINCFVCLSLVI